MSRLIESRDNPLFKSWVRLFVARKARELDLTMVAGTRFVQDVLASSPELATHILMPQGGELPANLPPGVELVYLAPPLFKELDIFGTRAPILLARPREIRPWGSSRITRGLVLGIPFQDPLNVGGAIRTAVGLSASGVLLLPGAASPWHPKAVRASAGSVFKAALFSFSREQAPELPVFGLDARGEPIDSVTFPDSFILLPGLEGPGLAQQSLPLDKTVGLPMNPSLESYNGMISTALAMYEWHRRRVQ